MQRIGETPHTSRPFLTGHPRSPNSAIQRESVIRGAALVHGIAAMGGRRNNMIKTVEAARKRQAKAIVAWLNGEAQHPQGKSGERWIIPPFETKRMWDTSQAGWQFSEWGTAAGIV